MKVVGAYNVNIHQEERKRRSEELQAKEDAVQERKQLIEADRLARIAHIEDKIKESQAKVLSFVYTVHPFVCFIHYQQCDCNWCDDVRFSYLISLC